MKSLNAILLSIIVLIGAAVSASAFAHGGRNFGGRHFSHRTHVGIGIGFGVPLYSSPWYYPGPYYYPAPYYYPPALVVPSSPPVYIEQGQAEAAPAAESYWYYCRESQTYYPYVKECAGPWQRVVPQPPPS